MLLRWLAGQFRRPHGLAGRLLLGPWLNRIAAPMNALALRELDLGAGDAFLEIGFGGGGLLAEALQRNAAPVLGADISDAMLARARRRFRREIAAGRLAVARASVEALPFADGAVDKAASVSNIFFWPDPEAAAGELARVVRPGGRLAILFEPPEELRSWPGHRFGFRIWSEAEVRALLAGAGFGRFRSAQGRGRRPARFLCLTGERLGG